MAWPRQLKHTLYTRKCTCEGTIQYISGNTHKKATNIENICHQKEVIGRNV